MAACANCGTTNIDGTKFCVSCGAQLGEAPAPESWRASSELNPPPPAADPGSTTGGYTPQTPPPSAYPTYTPQQSPRTYQPQAPGAGQPVHPAVAAIVSFFLPGIGLLFVPNKQKLAFMIFGGYIGLWVLLTIIAVVTLGIGACLFFIPFIANIGIAIHSWDEAAKVSGGQFQPLLFK
ncbi:MAG TPA: zinc-ribbon domain-containing protein [Pyrinomonadaceae bacterium]|jgi:hypothetical protein|nr:zinc-ribbon domain-containing protein [Pyrinomonadaceae bacterium]